MRNQRKILFHRVSAGFLVLLLIFIYVVKSVHAHPSQGVLAKTSECKENVRSAFQCAICDFHFSKDADDVVHFGHTADFIREIVRVFFFRHNLLITSIGDPASDRGPPSFI